MRLEAVIVLPLLFALSGELSWKTLRPVPEASSTNGYGHLVRHPDFTECELKAFMALDAGRNAISYRSTRESLLDTVDDPDPDFVAAVDELYDRIKKEGSIDYRTFASEKFFACTVKLNVPVEKNIEGASICFVRQDIPFMAYGLREKGKAKDEVVAQLHPVFAKYPEDVIPKGLIGATVNMIYNNNDGLDGFYEIRRFSFETCLYGDEWKAWWNSENPGAEIK